MTTLLQQAFTEAAKLSESEQEVLASRLLAELADEDDFDRAIARSSDRTAAALEAGEALARTSRRANGRTGIGETMNWCTRSAGSAIYWRHSRLDKKCVRK